MAPDRRQRARRDRELEQLLAARRARARRRRRRRGRSAFSIFLLLLVAAIALTAATAALTGSAILSRYCTLKELRPKSVGANSFLYANNHALLGVVPSAKNRQPLPLSKMSQWLPDATVAIEDARFYQHGALDYQGIGRALWDDLTSGRIEQGGSTLTQQLVRNLYIAKEAQEKTIARKLKEACLADKLFAREQKNHGKDARARILSAYLNQVFYGRHAFGVEAASRTYFSRSAHDLNLSQAALIAGLPQAPTLYNPLANPKLALERRAQVLRAMWNNGYINHKEFVRARNKPLGLRPGHLYTRRFQPNFFGWAQRQLFQRYGGTVVERGGLSVTTTLDPRLQSLALDAAKSVLHTPTDPATAVVAIDPSNGAVRAMVYYLPDGRHMDFNLAWQAHRSTGSAFKPITLATALDEGASLTSSYFYGPPELLITDPQCRTADGPNGYWDVHNSGDESAGTVNLISALAGSINTIFAQLVAKAGVRRVQQMAHWMGITSKGEFFPRVCAMTLGSVGFSPLELTDVYATIASGGIHHSPQAFEVVRGPNHKVLGRISTKGREVLAPNLDAELTYAMQQVITSGTGTAASLYPRPAAGKTGTAENYQDAWFCGFVPQLATCVWVGYPKAEIPMYNVEGVPTVFGGTLPAQIWHAFMAPATAPWPIETFPTPVFGGTPWTGTGTYGYAPTPYYPTYPAYPTTTAAVTHAAPPKHDHPHDHPHGHHH